MGHGARRARQRANGVSSHFDETDLGGLTFRVKVVIGR